MTRRKYLYIVSLLIAACIGAWVALRLIPARKTIEPQTKTKVDPIRSPIQAFLHYRVKDLTKLEDVQLDVLLQITKKLFPKRNYDHKELGFLPRRLWNYGKEGGHPVYLLLEDHRIVFHPGATPIRLTVLDDSGKTLSVATFSTGHRRYLRAEEVQVNGEHALLTLHVAGAFEKSRRWKQHYAKIDDRFDLVRVEDSEGNAVRNAYSPKHFRCGPKPPKQSESDWESDLVSDERLRILRALVWMGGDHDPRFGGKPDSDEEALLVRNVSQRRAVITRLKALCSAKDRWVRDAASLALNR